MKLTALLLVLLPFANSFAGPIGNQHNKYLRCLRRADSNGSLNVKQTLMALVKTCRFNPGMPARAFVQKYARLVPREAISGQSFTLRQVLRPHSRSFNQKHFRILDRVEKILKTNDLRTASRKLNKLHRSMSRTLGNSRSDAAIKYGLDIAASSALFWSQNSDGGTTRRAKWWQIVLGDVAGGIVGGIFGGGVGAVGLGTAVSQIVADNG